MLAIFSSANSIIDPGSVHLVWELRLWRIALALGAAMGLGSLFSWYFEINIFGLNQFYRNRLVRCYLGATRWTPGARHPNAFTGFDFRDDLNLWRFRTDSPGADVPGQKPPVPECGSYRGQLPWRRRGLSFSLYYLFMELLGIADEGRYFLNVSDGGHFENLAVYELVRRRCKLIIACDAECDEPLQFGGLGNLIRLCETD